MDHTILKASLALFVLGLASVTACRAEPIIAHVGLNLQFPRVPADESHPELPPLEDVPVGASSVYVGGGRFLTAAHVFIGKDAYLRLGETESRSRVTVGGREIPSINQIFAGWEPNTNRYVSAFLDLAVVYVRPESTADLDPEAARPCPTDPSAGDPVRVLAERGAVAAHVVRPLESRYAALDIVARPGDSGGGVFASNGCLAGLVSRDWPDPGQDPKVPVVKTNTLIVPASVIAAFLAWAPQRGEPDPGRNGAGLRTGAP